MGRHDTVRRIPQRIPLRQRLRVRDIQRRAAQALFPFAEPSALLRHDGRVGLARRDRGLAVVGVRFEGGDEVRLDDDLAARDIGDEGVALGEDVELRRAEQVVRLLGQRHADDQPVDVLREEVVQRGAVQPAVPGAGDAAVRVAGAGHDEAAVVLALRGGARGGGEGDDVHAHRVGDVGDLAADGAVAEHGEALAHVVADGAEAGGLALLAPEVLGLPRVEGVVGVRGDEGGQEDPFGDLGAVNAGGGGEGDGGFLVDRGRLDMVRAGGEEVDELWRISFSGKRCGVEREWLPSLGQREGEGGKADKVTRMVASRQRSVVTCVSGVLIA